MKCAPKSETVTTLRITNKTFRDGELTHETLLTARIKNVFANNFLKNKLSRIIQSGGFLGALLSKFAGPLIKVAVPLAKDILAPVVTMNSVSAIEGAIKRKMHPK